MYGDQVDAILEKAQTAYQNGLAAARNDSFEDGLLHFDTGLSIIDSADLSNSAPRLVLKLQSRRVICTALLQKWPETLKSAQEILRVEPDNTQALFFAALAERALGNLGTSLEKVKPVLAAVKPGSLKYWQTHFLMRASSEAMEAQCVVDIASSDDEVAVPKPNKGKDIKKRKRAAPKRPGKKQKRVVPKRPGKKKARKAQVTRGRQEVQRDEYEELEYQEAQREEQEYKEMQLGEYEYQKQVVPLLADRSDFVMDFNGSWLAGQKLTVNLYGQYSSGTHALLQYIGKYFDVILEPAVRKKDDGTLLCGEDLKVWKHTVPLGPLPAGASKTRDQGPLICIFVWREIRSWLSSLAAHPYELKTVKKQHRRQHKVWWMFHSGPVMLDVDASWGKNPFPNRKWKNAAALWVSYMRGYLEGKFFEGHCYCPPCFLVSHEEIVNKPREIYEALKHCGLPLKTDEHGLPLEFEPITASVHGGVESNETIDDIRARMRSTHDPFTEDEDSLEAMRRTLRPHKDIFAELKIDMP
mmetsp:Transcript_517/g.1235  ORF Transcript_517/g.1235 Transcript_517/m.1235 type:complete len:526 (+) Transcript_517:63-1640(+)|eukprot:CAMPEP_0206562060 /NCGR_PEP_ID=MMETSP0325_2-20121206/22000_1 /ASSEMBLY_ACC=CAM_ASM_000347 /TAXON_ID=2866 /ORGANISM="Crypthecodinium cohnii, Strain Seligo" /LENGTH=525 /DNA_ID=CAMNT_0054064151 /DNA_START=11 /DNA_END=1588 /DNA_ORIENTATION=-